jgi:hypothetical protein
MAAEREAVALDAIPGYDEETRAMYAGGLSEELPSAEDKPRSSPCPVTRTRSDSAVAHGAGGFAD